MCLYEGEKKKKLWIHRNPDQDKAVTKGQLKRSEIAVWYNGWHKRLQDVLLLENNQRWSCQSLFSYNIISISVLFHT